MLADRRSHALSAGNEADRRHEKNRGNQDSKSFHPNFHESILAQTKCDFG
jgi:hypothetical protein